MTNLFAITNQPHESPWYAMLHFHKYTLIILIPVLELLGWKKMYFKVHVHKFKGHLLSVRTNLFLIGW
jgi:hypothetical protein